MVLLEYPKIQTVYKRDPDTKYKTLLEGDFSLPEFSYLANNYWVFTEKVDGTNIRVFWDGGEVTFWGKTDKAQIPTFLEDKLREMFPAEKFSTLPSLCLYGEGYGAKIQKGGGNYISDGVSFILFDVRVGVVWLKRDGICDMAGRFNIDVVPIIDHGTLFQAIEMARSGFDSVLRKTPPEGLVMKPMEELSTRLGKRVITKIKLKDFQKG